MRDTDVDRYLERLQLAAPRVADADALVRLQHAHLLNVPFENLSIHWAEPMALSVDHGFRKIVDARRGGFCYECNGLFAALLQALGFPTALLSARVVRSDGSLGPEFDHLVLLVALETPWLVDVGFGHSFRTPMPLVDGRVQPEPGGDHRLVHADGRWILEGGTSEGAWSARFTFETTPRRLEAFRGMFEFHRDSPDSHFHRAPLATIATAGGRTTLSGRRLIRTTLDGHRAEEDVAEDDVPAVLAREFGIVRSRQPSPAR